MQTETVLKSQSQSKRWLSAFAVGAIALIFFLLLTINLDAAPAVDWDEGWNFTVAQNWVERSFYGRVNEGELAPPGLEASFPVVSSVALSFRLFGVGIAQGRLPAVITMVTALVLYLWVLRELFSIRIALVTIAILVLLIPHPRANVFWMARQMFGEPFQFLAILGGFGAWLLARAHSRSWMLLAAFYWAAAFIGKAQVLPFLSLALLAAVGLNLWNRRFQEALWISGAFVAAILGWYVGPPIVNRILQGWTLASAGDAAVFVVLGLVFTFEIRFTAFVVAWLVGTPIILGVFYFASQRIRAKSFLRLRDKNDDIRMALWILAVTWFLWFVGAAHAGIVRYIFSPIFFGAPFAALMLSDFTSGFDVRATLERMTAPLRTRKFTRQSFGAWLAFLLVLFYLPLTLSIGWGTWNAAEGREVTVTTEYLNRNSVPTARVETYESPLFLELERIYHFPPDALHLELNKRAARLPAVVDYDALQADPDYLVVGPTGRTWKLYDRVIAERDFRLLETFGQYEIYARVRR